MASILSLGRGRFAAFLAWFAIASLAAIGGARDRVVPEGIDGGAPQSVVHALHDGPGPVVRVVAAKVGAAVRNGDEPHSSGGGPDIADLPLAVPPAASTAVNPAYDDERASAAVVDRSRPYAARAPPLHRI